ncbi:UDP-N-acetylmuramoylalanine--D-glutamate ligase [Actinopolyspora xinjiangensis]|uniref:UDP-N-acetylmuramoylalanine--D-glutamate ligase n=1 Tax=Actinopolyspora xinjiangensis TaxID=405564 RepID=A0A1H0SSA8_9ACTN|nr:UDP-N-acetylmuramoyl-L-alanine--D-glutamate ligase [Actinopolyspora xinjiangensis]SDP44662.1 UDP-N-acetylmuramoylalanine--D-glutamate ligase [Actinopolyspora xinjiangensis]
MSKVGKRVLVAGAGVSGRSAAEALLERGAAVTVTDASERRLAELSELRARGAELVPSLTEPPAETDLVVTSPGWRPDSPLLTAAAAAGTEVIGEIELAWRIDRASTRPARWLAVTGTNGKTTTVGMLESVLRAAGIDAVACGNVGLPAVDAVRAGHRVLAVELSSFQLHWSNTLSPDTGVILNLADDHLDWHGSLHAYGAAKGKVYRGNSVSVHNADNAASVELAAEHSQARQVAVTSGDPVVGQLGVRDGELLDRAFDRNGHVPAGDAAPVSLAGVSDVRQVGEHNLANALAACALARSCGVPEEACARGLREFSPGEHRSDVVAEAEGVVYVDDSKATNPHAASAALGAHRDVVWIAGGLLKGAEVDELVRQHAPRLRAAVLIGSDQRPIAEALRRYAPEVPVVGIPPQRVAAMSEAVRLARAYATSGTAVVLAPAAASMDMYTDYAHRGREFTAAVRAVLAEPASGSAERPRG